MNLYVLIVLLLNFILIGLLPLVFFKKKDGYHLKWWLTGFSFFVLPVYLVNEYFEIFQFLKFQSWLMPSLFFNVMALFLSVCSIGLICLTLGTHRVPLHLWHQKNDDPEDVITFGAYKFIRHPFYSAFMLCFAASFLLKPTVVTLFLFVYQFFILNFTAKKEEQNLRNSIFGREYKDYMTNTKRFFPKIY